MKKIKTIVTIAIVILAISCKKEKQDKESLIGYWSGTYTYSSTNKPISFLFIDNNKVRYFLGNTDTSLAVKYDATYTAVSDSVQIAITMYLAGNVYVKYLGKQNQRQIAGDVKNETIPSLSGTFIIYKR